jgi:hypothetical protein
MSRSASTSIASINAAAPKDLILAGLHLRVREGASGFSWLRLRELERYEYE